MLGYYRLDEEKISKLPNNSNDIEENIYELCFPLVIDGYLSKDLQYLYETLEIPIIEFNEIDSYDDSKYVERKKQIQAFLDYLKLNTSIEMLEEGSVGHTLRVGRYAKEMCELLKLGRKESKEIYIAAILHDIGKSQIPDKILSKPDKLNKKELEIMKTHSELGVNILEGFFSENILDLILSHHERCDLSGYPRGIMPSLGAKIIGIADSFDAMLSNRVYKKNKTLKAALEELVRCSLPVKRGGIGVLYDEEIVRKFVDFHGYNRLSSK